MILLFCFLIGMAGIMYGIMDNSLLLIFLGLILSVLSVFLAFKKKTETPLTIYTSKDIYYIYKDSITSESGDIGIVKDFKQAYIELLTAKDLDSCMIKN